MLSHQVSSAVYFPTSLPSDSFNALGTVNRRSIEAVFELTHAVNTSEQQRKAGCLTALSLSALH
jgi:hypothetical protein